MNNEHRNMSSFNPDAATADQEGWTGSQRAGGYTVSPDAATVDDGVKMNLSEARPVTAHFKPKTSFNPDAPTSDSLTGATAASAMPFRTNGFNPDAPTSDSETGVTAASATPHRTNGFNPDAPTSDADAGTPAPSAKPFRPNAAFNPDAPTSASDDGPASPAGDKPASSGKNKLPFKPMSGGAKTKPVHRNSPPSVPATETPAPIAPKQEPSYVPPKRKASDDSFVPQTTTGSEQKYQPDYRSFTLKEMEKLEDRRYEAEMQLYKQAMSKWKSRLWIPFAAAFGLVLLILLGGAFAGAFGVVFLILAAAAAIAILFATGKMKWLALPRKPQKQLPQRGTPELTSVYSVRLRLKSMNLPKPVEVVIRKEEQLIGCDKNHCIQPLDYKGISHRHCMIISRYQHGHTEYYIRDENSKNGTRLNERKLDPGVEYPLQIGDVVTLAGRYQFRVLSDAY